MANEYGGKREEIRGFTVLDIRNINNNFRTLWQTQFGNATYTDQSQALTVKINNIDNKASRVAKDIESHKNSYHFNGEYGDLKNKPEIFNGEYEDLKNKPETFNPAYTFLSVGGINYLKQGKLIFMQGNVKISENMTGNITLFKLPDDFKPYNDSMEIFFTNSKKTLLGAINKDGNITVELGEEIIGAEEIIIINNTFIGE